MYPFVKVSVTEPFGRMTTTDLEDSPVIARLLAAGWKITRRWEVLGPGYARNLDVPTE